MSRLLPRENEIRLPAPASANESLQQIADRLRDQGFSVLQVGSDVLHAHQPPSTEASPFTVQRWLPSGRMTIRRSETEITIAQRFPIFQSAASSLLFGIVTFGAFTTAPAARLWVAGGVSLGFFLFLLHGHRRKRYVLMFGNPPANAESLT